MVLWRAEEKQGALQPTGLAYKWTPNVNLYWQKTMCEDPERFEADATKSTLSHVILKLNANST